MNTLMPNGCTEEETLTFAMVTNNACVVYIAYSCFFVSS